jgi:hypothetical protein
MVGLYHIPFTSFWVVCGLVGLVGSAMIGGLATGRIGAELSRLAIATPRDETRVRLLQQRLRLLAGANLLLLLSVVWAMVSKPML